MCIRDRADEVDELNGTVLASVGDGKAAASDSEGVQGANGCLLYTSRCV